MEFAAIFTGYNWIPLVCIFAGIIFIIIEMYQPGFGVPGVIGILLVAAGIILYARTVLQALIMIAVVLAILGAALSYLIGSEGRTVTVLRPSGIADFNGVRLDVVSGGEYIPKGTIVYVDKIEGNKIVVKQSPRTQ